jgi:putative membrane protein
MSLRQFYPKQSKRKNISSWKLFFLYAVLIVAIGLQIAYPLIDGEVLRVVTIATVYWAAGAMMLHAIFAYGFVYAFTLLSIILPYALLVELVGSRTGWPFGNYEYSGSLGYQIYGVPLVVPFAWVMIAHPILIMARKVTRNWVFLYGGLGMMAWDLFLDPQMVVAKRWVWDFDGASVPLQPEIPLSNTFGWLLTGMGLMAILNRSLQYDRKQQLIVPNTANFFLAWTYFSGIIGNLFFFNMPGVAVSGGIVFGLLLIPYIFVLWLGPPTNI